MLNMYKVNRHLPQRSQGHTEALKIFLSVLCAEKMHDFNIKLTGMCLFIESKVSLNSELR